MKAWLISAEGKSKIFFRGYGKVTVSFFFLLIIFMSLVSVMREISPQKLRVSFLDIGQGDAILIQTPSGHDMLIDGGPTDGVLARLSDELGFFDRDIEVMISTHGDADHVTGLIPVLEKYEVKIVVSSPVAAKTGIFDDLEAHIGDEGADVHLGKKGDEIDFGDGVVAHVLYPSKNLSSKIDTNDASVSIVLTYGEHSFLLTGDLTTKYESQLIGGLISLRQSRESADSNITVYKAGHHGSRTSSGEQLLTYIKPEYAIISAGVENKYGHPNIETIARLEKYAKETLSTINRGTISFVSDGRMMEVETDK